MRFYTAEQMDKMLTNDAALRNISFSEQGLGEAVKEMIMGNMQSLNIAVQYVNKNLGEGMIGEWKFVFEKNIPPQTTQLSAIIGNDNKWASKMFLNLGRGLCYIVH